VKPPSPSLRSGRKGLGALAFLLLSAALSGAVVLTLWAASTGKQIPAAPLDRLTAAKVAWADRQWPEADRLLREILAADPGNRKARILLGRMLLERGHLEEAREHFGLLVKADPQDPEANRGMGWVMSGIGQKTLASLHFRRAAQARKDDPALWKELGLAQRDEGDGLGALASLQKSFSLDPRQSDVSHLLSELATGGDRLASSAPEGPVRKGMVDPMNPRPIDPESLVPKPKVPDPTRFSPRPGARTP